MNQMVVQTIVRVMVGGNPDLQLEVAISQSERLLTIVFRSGEVGKYLAWRSNLM